MRRRKEVYPTDEYVAAVIRDVIAPIQKELEIECGERIPLGVTLFTDYLSGPSILVAEDDRDEAKGEVRLRFAESFKPERLLFSAFCIFNALQNRDAASGFAVRGDVKPIGGSIIATKKGWLVHGNTREWPENQWI